LIIITTVSNQQLSFMQNKDLGIEVDKVIILRSLNFDKEVWSNEDGGYVVDSSYLLKAENFKEDVRNHTGFEGATALSHLPGQLPNWGTEFKEASGQSNKAYRIVAIGVDHDFLSTLQVKLLAGRNFSRDIPSDRGNEARRAVLLNEAASKLLGFPAPGDAVGKHISTYWGANYEVIGVVNSFHQLSLKQNLQPLYFILQPRALEYFAVRYQTETSNAATKQLQSIWQRHFPDYPFSSFYLDEYFNQQYTYDKKFGGVMAVLSALAILISCLGLFGMTSLAMTQRTKEIGIRKVLGATASSVIGLFTSDFFRLIILADIIFIPIAYVAVDRWLGNYAFRITPDWWYFALPALLTLGIALVTITLQTFKAAVRNPVDSLRYD
jgi:putative ABC transport system permease protein